MSLKPFVLVSPATRGLSCALTRCLLRKTNLPVYATYRSGAADDVKRHILSPLADIDSSRLQVFRLDLEQESSISSAASNLRHRLPEDSYLDTAFFTGGILHPEKHPGDLNFLDVQKTFQINVISHLMLMKHFSQFLPSSTFFDRSERPLSRWVHISARVGSITDNKMGGWYSYRTSKAALNQALHTFDLHLQQKKIPALCVGLHPGTVRTELSKDFWKSVPDDKLFEPDYAAEKLVDLVSTLKEEQRGKVWDWAGKQVPW